MQSHINQIGLKNNCAYNFSMDTKMKFKIFRLLILCLTAIFVVYLYTQNTGDNACYKKGLDVNNGNERIAYYECYFDRRR